MEQMHGKEIMINKQLIQKQYCYISDSFDEGKQRWYTTTLQPSRDQPPLLCQLHCVNKHGKFNSKKHLQTWIKTLQGLPDNFPFVPYTSLSEHAKEVVLRSLRADTSLSTLTIYANDPWWNGLDNQTLIALKNDFRKLDGSFWGGSHQFAWDIYRNDYGENTLKISTECVNNLHWDTAQDPLDFIRFPLPKFHYDSQVESAHLHSYTPNVKIQNPYIENTSSSSQTNIPRCPTCGSSNLQRITNMQKAVSVWAFGLLSQKVKRQFHCNNCGYEW